MIPYRIGLEAKMILYRLVPGTLKILYGAKMIS